MDDYTFHNPGRIVHTAAFRRKYRPSRTKVTGLMLGHAFQNFDEVWFHIAPPNIRSQKATLRLGAQYMGDAFIDLSGGPTLWMCFRLSRRIWEEHIASRVQDSEAT